MLELALLLGQLGSWVVIAHLMRRQQRMQAEMRAAVAEQSIWREIADELASMRADLEATLKRVGAELDARAAELRELVEQAEAGVAYLRQELEARKGPAVVFAPTSQIRCQETTMNRSTSQYSEVARLAASGMDPVEIARRNGLGREEIRLILGRDWNTKGGSG